MSLPKRYGIKYVHVTTYVHTHYTIYPNDTESCHVVCLTVYHHFIGLSVSRISWSTVSVCFLIYPNLPYHWASSSRTFSFILDCLLPGVMNTQRSAEFADSMFIHDKIFDINLNSSLLCPRHPYQLPTSKRHQFFSGHLH